MLTECNAYGDAISRDLYLHEYITNLILTHNILLLYAYFLFY